MTIHIGRKAVALSYIRYFLNTFSNILILPVILTHITQEEYGLWSIFLSIDAGIGLIELGLGTVITRYVTYAYCGAASITLEGLPANKKDSETNTGLLLDVVYAARQIYVKMTAISAILFMGATVYILNLAVQLAHFQDAVIGWIIFCAGCLFRIYFTYYSSFVKGIGKIKELEKIHIFLGVLYMMTRMIFIWLGWGLVGLGIANAIDVILGRLLVYGPLKDFIRKNYDEAIKAKQRSKDGNNSEIKNIIWENSKQMGIVTIINYISGQGKSLLCSIILPLSVMGQFSLTNQVVAAVASMSMIPYNAFRVQMGDAMVKRDREKTNDVLSFILLMFIVTAIAGGAVTLFFGGKLIALIKSTTMLLDNKYVFLLLIYSFIISLNQICTGYISLKNIQPFITSYVVAGVSGMVCAYLSYLVVGADGLDCYVYAILITQLVYNAWRWPLYVCKDTGITLRGILMNGRRYLIKVIRGKNV